MTRKILQNSLQKAPQSKILVLVMVYIGVILMSLSFVSAWSNNTFNNSLAMENLTFTGNENVTRWIQVPNSVSTLISGYLNLSGFVSSIYSSRIGYWNMDEGFGKYINETSNKHNLNGSFNWINGVKGNATYYNKTTPSFAYNSTISSNSFNLNISGGTIMAWVRLNSSSLNQMLITGASSGIAEETGYDFSVNAPNSVLLGRIFSYTTDSSAYFTPTLNEWIHLTMVWNSSTLSIYRNGTIQNFTIHTLTEIRETNRLCFGARCDFNNLYNGSLDEIKIFNISLTAEQILSEMEVSNTPSNPYLSISSEQVWNFSGQFSQTNNKTLNFAKTINKYLNATYLIGTNYIIPFVFHSDTIGILQYSDLLFSSEDFLENSQTFNSTTYETSSETFSINLTYDSSYYSSIVANLIYNGTSYTGTSSGSENNIIFSKTITIPSVSSQTNKTFYWSIGLSNATGTYYFNSSFNNQTINPLGFGLCGGNLNIVAINFSAKNETSLVGINSFNFAGTFEIWAGTGSIVKTNSTINTTGVNSITFCISQNTTYYINAYIDYSASGFSQRSYYLRNAVINNVTNNITLYLLDSSLSTSIIINVKDRYLTNLKNHLIKVLRYYPGYGEYYLVETAKTDDFGNAIIKVQQENVDYKFIIENSSGSQIYLSNAMRIICTATPCILEFITGETEHIVQQLIDFAYVSYNLVWNNNTGYVTFDYSDSSGLTQTMRLLVIKINAYGETTICDDTISEPAGILTCYIGANATGEYSAKVYRTASPTKYFAQLNISLTNIWQKFGKEALIGMLFFVITMFFAGLAVNPATAAILTLVSMVFMMATGIVYMPLIVVISVGVVVVLFIIKMRS